MKPLIFALSLFVFPLVTSRPAAEPLAPDFGPKLTGWTYHTAARPLADQYADPGDRLSDGKAGRGAGVAIWQGGSVTIDLELGGPAKLSAIRVSQHRHNLNYKLDYLAVNVRRGGTWEERARQPGFFGPTPTMDFVHTLDLKGVETDAMRLDFAGAGVLSLSEIELFGTRAAAQTQGVGAYAAVPFRTDPAPTAREEDLDGDGQPEVVLENGAVRLIFSPARGGVCRSLRLKPSGTELVYSRESGYGLLRDQLWKPQYSFAERVYFHKLENTADHAAVELWTTGVGGMMSFTEIRKRITLGRDGPVAQVHYTLTNEPSSQTDYEYGFWSHNWLGETGATNTYYFPTTDGVQSFTLDVQAAKASDEAWYRNPARGWTAVATDDGNGLAIEVPYRYLSLFYQWHGAGALAATHEWRHNLLEVKAGEKLEWDYTLIPFTGLKRVDGVVAGAVGAFEASTTGDDLTLSARLHWPAGSPGGPARLVLRSLTDGTEHDLAGSTVGEGGVLSAETRYRPEKPGTYVLRWQVERAGKPVVVCERPLTIGDVRVAYHLEPECEREGKPEEVSATRPGHEISTEVVTPHVPWARPFAGGKIRALVLMDDMNCREAVELAERIDLDLDYVKFRTTLDKELLYQGDLSILTLDAAQKALAERLKTRQYDVIVLSGFKWDFHFTPEIRAAILDHVSRGTGLVLIQPDGFDEEAAQELPVAGVAKAGTAGRSMWAWHKWSPAGDDPLVTGLDWDRFPVTRRHEYEVPPQGDVIATLGKDGAPLLTLGTHGKGRAVSATWDTLTHDLSYRGYSALTPILSYRGGWLQPQFAALPTGYQEWWFALLTRMTAWAAGRDTGVSIVAAPPVHGRLDGINAAHLNVTVLSARVLPDAKVETHWFNAVGAHRATTTTPVVLAAGATEAALAVPAPPNVTLGDNTACFIVRDGGGASVAWGFTTVSLAGPTRIEKVAVAPDTLLPKDGVWQEDGPVETRAFTPDKPLKVTVALTTPAPQAMTVDVVLTDTYGRQLARAGLPVAAAATSVETTFDPPTLVDQGIRVAVQLREGDTVWDERETRALAYRPRVWNRFWYTSWGGQWLWRSHYLFDFNSRLVRDFGVDVSFEGDTELNTGKVRDNAFWGINHSWLGLLSYLGKGVADFMDTDFAKKAAEYAKTGDKQYLVRTPSLVDPEWRDGVRKSLIERAQRTMPAGGTYDYCMGDEMSLTSYTRFHDYDWSPTSLADFRRWLKERYATLDALNAAWSTAYKQWDEVVPLTCEEAQKADNPAPWFEFRMYMNDQLADCYRFIQDTIRGVDPNARCDLSGTQSPEAGNGMDWWKLSKAFSYYHSYNTSWSNEMRRSFQRDGGADQSPYFSGYSATDPNAENRMWWCLLHDTRGISAWCTGLFFYGDFSRTESGRDTQAHLETFKRGIWRLLRGAKRQHDGVAIYYSMPSIIAGALTGEEEKLNAARDSWVKLIEDCGLQYEFIAYDQVAKGILKNGEFKVVILPYELALSKAETDELRAFVKAGGAIVATRPVGIRDELGRPQTPGLLDDVFGARLEGAAQAVEPTVTLTEGVAGLAAGTEIKLPVATSQVVLAGAKARGNAAAGEIPVLTAGADGRALLLNLDLTHFEQERRFHSPTEKQLKAIVLDLLAGAGVKPKHPLALASGKPSQVEMVRYVADGLEYLCLLNAADEAEVATIDLGAKRHVYDVRGERDRGETDKLTVPLDPLCARVYCLSPQSLPGPTLSAANGNVTRGGALAFAVGRRSSGPAPQLIRVTVADAEGKERQELTLTVWVRGDPVPASVPLALNDPPGPWKLTATDVVSGQRATATVTVK